MAGPERKLTDAELAILSLLAERPMHGYQIEQLIEARGMREWVEMGFSSIYYLLKKLRKAGMLSSRLAEPAGRGPARQVFHLTEQGRDAWKKGVMDALARPHRGFSNFDLGLSNIDQLNNDAVISALKEYLQMLKERSTSVEAKYQSYGAAIPFSAEVLFQYSLDKLECEIRAVEKILKRMGG